MQCSLCDKVALRVVGVGKAAAGFYKTHESEAYDAAAKLKRINDSKNHSRITCRDKNRTVPTERFDHIHYHPAYTKAGKPCNNWHKKPKLKQLSILLMCALSISSVLGGIMKKRIKINVTQRDIIKGAEDIEFGKEICQVCPVARAFRRHKGFETTRVVAHNAHEEVGSSKPYWSIVFNNPEISNWINTFDIKSTRNECKPFQFTIEVPECLLS